jgi:SAM-dependent methyltransferase
MEKHSYRGERNAFTGIPYRITFYAWRHSPDWFRAFFYKGNLAKRAKLACRDFLARFAGREDLYSDEYYVYVDREASKSAPTIASFLLSWGDARRIVDVGCGTGALLSELRDRGVKVTGLEYSKAALKICQKRGLDVLRFNVEDEEFPQIGEFDVAVCFEVAEHLSAKFADSLVALLVHLAPRVVFTAATPGQGGGADHVNEQPHEYWISKFAQRHFQLHTDLTVEWRRHWEKAGVSDFYSKNVMVFERSGAGSR